MGLTAAEAFMLICFILLLLLSLWMETTREATKFNDEFTPGQRAAAVLYREQLQSFGQKLEDSKSFEQLVVAAGGEGRLRDALIVLQEFSGIPVQEVADRIRLLDEDVVKRISEAAVELEPNTKLSLAELTELEAFPAIIDVANNAPNELLDSIKKLREYQATGLSAEEMQGLLASIEHLRDAELISGERVASEIRKRAGSLISSMGGEILDNGNVVFPESLLFDPGRSNIKPVFEEVLSNFCVPWLEVLYGFDTSLRNIQIEGHASSEWNGTNTDGAFRNNLDLSQARAANVYKRCLDFADATEFKDWAKSRLAAVGYSSARPVLDTNSKEDRVLSRRVVFAVDLKTLDDMVIENFLDVDAEHDVPIFGEDVKSTVTVEPEFDLHSLPTPSLYIDLGYKTLQGTVDSVTDGDTITVAAQKVRIQGLHAPELSDPFGEDARRFMENHYLDQPIECLMSGERTFDRLVGVCFVDEIDIAGELVRAGLGLDCPSFSFGRYALLEQKSAQSSMELPSYCQ
ncbi:OmpA family protein [Pacificibacter marinus]|uniref:Flagellar motor protein MotS n=1 Tax=Pacificibacter marinus TaxID=658057 RepID=A0A1Y5T3A6_9RHOB|nr:OmpA family protein [Pacificibacter marinus]SEL00526.1 Flagellar motor protein MotB [Pacificibacter marinus]SLN54811.1 flagellar motor protein MotS [Pacificibacter marinus]